MANQGFGFVGFCFMVAWLVLLAQAAWRFRYIIKDRFEYVSVAVFPIKAATMFCVCMLAFWRLTLGELWWFRDAQDTTVTELLTFFVDAMSRPAVLAFVSLIWARDVSSVLPKSLIATPFPPTSQFATAPPAPRDSLTTVAQSGTMTASATGIQPNSRKGSGKYYSGMVSEDQQDDPTGSGGGGSTAAGSENYMRGLVGVPSQSHGGRGGVYTRGQRRGNGGGSSSVYSPKSDDEYEGTPTTASFRPAGAPVPSGGYPGDGGVEGRGGGSRSTSRDQHPHDLDRVGQRPHSSPTQAGDSISSGSISTGVGRAWAHALAYVGLARAYVLGDDGAALPSLANSPHSLVANAGRNPGSPAMASVLAIHHRGVDAVPWEQRARWRLVLATRWIALMLVCWAGLYIGLLTWTSTMEPISCALLEDPESTGCYSIASGNHIVYVEPRVYTVVALLTNSFLFASTVWSGLSHLERIGHLQGRRTFRMTLLKASLFQAAMIFCLFMRIFDNVRFNGGWNVFFVFCEDVAMMAYLWTLVFHIETAAKRRRATGRVADLAHHVEALAVHCATTARDAVRKHAGRCWARLWRVERDTEPHHHGAELHQHHRGAPPASITSVIRVGDREMSAYFPSVVAGVQPEATPSEGGFGSGRRHGGLASITSVGGGGVNTMLSSQHSRTSSGLQRMNSTFDFFSSGPQPLQQTNSTANGSDTLGNAAAAVVLESSAFSPFQKSAPLLDLNEIGVTVGEGVHPRRGQQTSNGHHNGGHPNKHTTDGVGATAVHRGNVGSTKMIGSRQDTTASGSSTTADVRHTIGLGEGGESEGTSPREGGAAPSGRSTRAPSSGVTSEPPALLEDFSPHFPSEWDGGALRSSSKAGKSTGLKQSSQITVDHVAQLLQSAGAAGAEDALDGTLNSTQNSTHIPLDSLFSFVDAPPTPGELAGTASSNDATTAATAASPRNVDAPPAARPVYIEEDVDAAVTEEVARGEDDGEGATSLTDHTSGSPSHHA